jgi:hypothetical protein
MTWPPEDIPRVIADAYELRGRKGADLLSHMGSFDLWHGNLAEMRGDSPKEPASETDNAGDTDQFLQTVAISRAFDLLQPRCAEVVRLVYIEGRDVGQVANELDTTYRYAESLVGNCLHRLVEVAWKIYLELMAPSDEATLGQADRDTHPATSLLVRAGYDGIASERK